MNEHMNENMNEHMNEHINEHMNRHMNRQMNEHMNEHMNEQMNEHMNEHTNEHTNEHMNELASTSMPKSWIRRIKRVGVHPWAPSSRRPFVTHGPLSFNRHASIHLSTVSSAISRYVVHLPPADQSLIF